MTKSRPHPAAKPAVSPKTSDTDSGEQIHQSKTGRKRKRTDPSRYIKVSRLGKVSIYRRGSSYWIYFRDDGKTVRKKIDGDLATAKATASQVNVYLEQNRPSQFNYQTKSVATVVDDFLDHCKLARGLRVRTVRRYRAALDHFVDFIKSRPNLYNIDQVKESTVDEFVRYMHDKKRVRSGEKKGPRGNYTATGIAFILSTCRTLFNYAHKRRLLSPYTDNPFADFPIDKLRSREPSSVKMLPTEQLADFFSTCDEWQFPVFFILSLYGLRIGELTHLLISDVDWAGERFYIRSKPFMQWYTKTSRKRILPIVPEIRPIFETLIGDRQEGFVFLSRLHWQGDRESPQFTRQIELENYMSAHVDQFNRDNPTKTDVEIFNFVRRLLHGSGKMREEKVREEFMQVAKEIGHPEVTTVHSLRHLFATLAEENGLNPLTVQTILGHSKLAMTGYYTHTGLEAKKGAIQSFLQGKCQLDRILSKRLIDSQDFLGDGISARTRIGR